MTPTVAIFFFIRFISGVGSVSTFHTMFEMVPARRLLRFSANDRLLTPVCFRTHQVGLRRLQQEMVGIAHQNVGMEPPSRSRSRLDH